MELSYAAERPGDLRNSKRLGMRIVVAVSENHSGCTDLISAVASFPWPTEAVFSVLTVAEIIPPPLELAQDVVSVPDMQSTAEATAMSAAAQLKKDGFDAHGVDREGDPKTVIVSYAKEWGADLIMVGACDKSPVEKFFLGNVSESVVKHSPCSVLVVKSSTRENQ